MMSVTKKIKLFCALVLIASTQTIYSQSFEEETVPHSQDYSFFEQDCSLDENDLDELTICPDKLIGKHRCNKKRIKVAYASAFQRDIHTTFNQIIFDTEGITKNIDFISNTTFVVSQTGDYSVFFSLLPILVPGGTLSVFIDENPAPTMQSVAPLNDVPAILAGIIHVKANQRISLRLTGVPEIVPLSYINANAVIEKLNIKVQN